MDIKQCEKPQATVVEFGKGDMGRCMTTSGDMPYSGGGNNAPGTGDNPYQD